MSKILAFNKKQIKSVDSQRIAFKRAVRPSHLSHVTTGINPVRYLVETVPPSTKVGRLSGSEAQIAVCYFASSFGLFVQCMYADFFSPLARAISTKPKMQRDVEYSLENRFKLAFRESLRRQCSLCFRPSYLLLVSLN